MLTILKCSIALIPFVQLCNYFLILSTTAIRSICFATLELQELQNFHKNLIQTKSRNPNRHYQFICICYKLKFFNAFTAAFWPNWHEIGRNLGFAGSNPVCHFFSSFFPSPYLFLFMGCAIISQQQQQQFVNDSYFGDWTFKTPCEHSWKS